MNTSIISGFLAVFMGLAVPGPAFGVDTPSPWPLPSEDLASVTAVISVPDGRLAWAQPGEKAGTSVLYFQDRGSGESRSAEVSGEIRAVLLLPASDAILAIVHRKSRRRPQVTQLQSFAMPSLKARRLSVLPITARGLTLWKGTNKILVACGTELRSFFLPDFRSGPLYLLPGGNFSMAQIEDQPLFLVSQENNLVLVNLLDPQGREELPVRKTITTRTPLRVMVLSDDLTRLQGLTLEGEPVDLAVDWLDLAAAATPYQVQTDPTPEPAIVERAEPAAVPQPEATTEPGARSEPEAVPEPVAVHQPEATPEPEAVPEPIAVHQPEAVPDPVAVLQVEQEPELEPVHEPAQEPAPSTRTVDPNRQVGGRLTGPASGQVQSVVLLGPDSILKEAARTKPDSDGYWSFATVPPGRYRVVLDAGSDRVVLSSPRYQTIHVKAGEQLEVSSFLVKQTR